ncbi:MAG TPA: GntR family transcriptional regulator [Oceanobacillus sp.]|nr:GntR family transcriptional regulator [Oceanobacillus sp.]
MGVVVTKATRAETVAAALREAILKGDYLSGERLIELSLAKTFDVSQNTVRDAIRLLEQDGWVVKHARHGVYVRSFTPDEAAEVFALIIAVEALALEWALQTMTKSGLQELGTLMDAARKHSYKGDWLAAMEAVFRFHETLAQIAGKPLTIQAMAQLFNQLRLLEALRHARAPRSPHELNTHIQWHERLYHAIEAGDLPEAQRLLREQMQSYGDTVLAALKMA